MELVLLGERTFLVEYVSEWDSHAKLMLELVNQTTVRKAISARM
jgi:hypothetical protein